MVIKEELRSAIDARNIISFLDKNGGYRELEPHHYGQRVRTVQYTLLKNPPVDSVFGFQVGGVSESNSKKGKEITFREFKLHEISDLRVNKERFFEVRKEYDPNDRRWVIEYGVANSPGDLGNRKK